jgi:thiol:disulfide interchange protein
MTKYNILKNAKLKPSAIRDAPYMALTVFWVSVVIMTYQLVKSHTWMDLEFQAPILIGILLCVAPKFMIRSNASKDWFARVFSTLAMGLGFWFMLDHTKEQPEQFSWVLGASVVLSVLFFSFLFGKGGKKYDDSYFDEKPTYDPKHQYKGRMDQFPS